MLLFYIKCHILTEDDPMLCTVCLLVGRERNAREKLAFVLEKLTFSIIGKSGFMGVIRAATINRLFSINRLLN